MAVDKKAKDSKPTSDELIAELEKKYGMQRVNPTDLTTVSTGSLQLNQAMGVGGTAIGKIVELFGPNSSGKSTLTLHQMSEYQKAFPDKRVALFDYEHTFNKKYATSLGVDVNSLLIYQPETQEEGYDLLIKLVENRLVSCVVIDSQTAATPKAILEGDMSDATMALQARINSKFCLKIKGLLDINGCTMFVVSQTRDSIGNMGEGTITTGGNAFKFYADVRWKVWKINDKEGEANKTTVEVVKNKLAPPFGIAKFNIQWGTGIDRLKELIDYAVEFDIIKRTGSWLSYGEDKVQGTDKMKDFLESNVNILLDVEGSVLDKLKTIRR